MERAPAEDDHGASSSPGDSLLQRLARRTSAAPRYEIAERIGQGGMGFVLRVRDKDLGRDLAMKVARELGEPDEDAARRARFLTEARVTGRLDHPGIVPVHELGVGPDGAPFFTMKLVQGRDLADVIRMAREGQDGWNRTRLLEVLLRACEAVAFAHARGVVHRDLKPDNIRVGDFGEVYVMDWGLARVRGDEGARDLRLARPADDSADDELGPRTLDGLVIGTPAFMSPEQAQGSSDQIDERTDVYALGAILYVILSGRTPYVHGGERPRGWEIVRRVVAGDLRPVSEVATDAPPELCAICERSMARRREDRYADVGELAVDLRAYLEGRVVRAHRTGALAELTAWVRRNRRFAAASAFAILALVGGLGVSSWLWSRSERRQREVFQLSVARDIDALVQRADELWPIGAELVPRARVWLDDARALLDGSRGRPGLAQVEATLAELTEQLARGTDEDLWWYGQLEALVTRMRALQDPSVGLVSGVDPERGPGIERRVAKSLEVDARTSTSADARQRWAEARRSIADRAENPRYDGLDLPPQRGLLPLRRNPASGLWEFWHVSSGDEPRMQADGTYDTRGPVGLVLVLIPGGRVRVGAQSEDPARDRYDPYAAANESPIDEVELAPFFIGRHELTQEQWRAFTGRNPSANLPTDGRSGFPVEQVSWDDAQLWLPRHGLTLPSEAQWEYSARAGTDTAWWTGAERASLQGAANLADLRFVGRKGTKAELHEAWDDGFANTARVGSFRANGFGLHDVCGNVQEWCLDAKTAYGGPRRPHDGVLVEARDDLRALRGGSWDGDALVYARSAARTFTSRSSRIFNMGLRAARALDP